MTPVDVEGLDSADEVLHDSFALAGGPGGPAALLQLITVVTGALAAGAHERRGPIVGGLPGAVTHEVQNSLDQQPLPDRGVGAGAALGTLTRSFARGAVEPAHPWCAAHLHCPPLAVAVAAEVAAAALNPSLDSWDQAPSATALEKEVVAALAELVGFPSAAGGVVTSGGTESNLMGLLLARDRASVRTSAETSAAAASSGRPRRLRVFCSELAHFSVQRSAMVLGLGRDAVVPVPVDGHHRMELQGLAERLAETDRSGDVAAVVATAGTTDFGSIDPLAGLAALAHRHRAWLHVDAAYGGGALFSPTLAQLLEGLDRADSVALDLHKLGWQPVAAGVFLTRRLKDFEPLAWRASYLNALDDEEAGYSSLLGRSLRTTRRADAFKIAVTLRALGRIGLGRLVDACHHLTQYAAARIDAHPRLELCAEPVLTTLVFRFRARSDSDGVNARIRRRLLAEGTAVIGRTEHGGSVLLKLTLLNPHATRPDVDGLVGAVVAAGEAEDR